MKAAWFNSAQPVTAAAPRGAAQVGMLTELPTIEMGAILLLRQWCDGPEAQAQIVRDFTLAFGTSRADRELERFANLVQVVLSCGTRPLMRHGADCQCFGGDESAFANMIAAAAAGEREDALIFALALMTPAAAFAAAQAAEPVGRAILGLAKMLQNSVRPDFTRH